MANNLTPIDKTSKKIRAASKILPFLINREDKLAIEIVVDFIIQSLENLTKLDSPTN